MKITVLGRKCTPRDSFKERVEQKLSKIEKLFPDDAQAKVTASVEKITQIVEITVFTNNMIFRAEENAESLEAALDLCVDSLTRQIRKNKTKLEKKLRRGAFDDFAAPDGAGEETEFEVIRTKTVDLRPQSVDEAILQMNMLGHTFYMFLNGDTGDINVVYRRSRDGGYGVLEPNS